MATLTISLPESQKEFVDAQAAAAGLPSASDYISMLIHQAEMKQERERIDDLLEEALRSEASEMTAEDWKDIRREVTQELTKQPQE